MIDQYFTPLWMAEALVERHFGRLDSSDMVYEPMCGPGAFLQAIPAYVPAVGVDLDPAMAEEARRRTGRKIIVGDCRSVEIDFQPTAIIGNPPFKTALIDAFMDRAYSMLPEGGRVGFILPAYFFQTASRVVNYAERWSLAYEFIPRNAFHKNMEKTLLFAMFSKDRTRTLIGFALYHETVQIHAIEQKFQDILRVGSPHQSAWRAVFDAALNAMGGEADLSDIYQLVSKKRPTECQFWREKIRQVAQQHYCRVAPGRYKVAA